MSIARAASAVAVGEGAERTTWTFDDVLLGTCPWCDAAMDADATTCPSCGGRTTLGRDRTRIAMVVAAVVVAASLAGWGTAALLRDDGGSGSTAPTGARTPATGTRTSTSPERLDATATGAGSGRATTSSATATTSGAVQGPPATGATTSTSTSGAATTTPATPRRTANAAGVLAATAAQADSCITSWNADTVARDSLGAFATGAGGATVRAVALQQPGRRCRFSFQLAGSDGQVMDYVRTTNGFRRTDATVTHAGFADDTTGVAQPFAMTVATDGATVARTTA